MGGKRSPKTVAVVRNRGIRRPTRALTSYRDAG